MVIYHGDSTLMPIDISGLNSGPEPITKQITVYRLIITLSQQSI
jgi:hypothetical protein